MNQKLVKIEDSSTTAPNSPADDDARLPAMTPEEEAAAICAGRAHAAMTVAAIAWRSANRQLEDARRTRRITTVCAAALGIAGIAALASFEVWSPDDSRVRSLILAMAVLAASAPLGVSLVQEERNRAREDELSAAKANANSSIRRAKRLAEVGESSLSAGGMPLEIWRPLDALLFDVEQAAAVAKSSAKRLRVDGAAAEQGRRHARIYPRNTRTILATGGSVRFIVDIIDVSVSGVAVEGVLPGIGVGSDVVIGSRKGRVVRLLARGLAIEFATPIPEHTLDRDIVL